MKRLAVIVFGLLCLVCAWLLLAPTGIDPVAWTPLPNPLGNGPFVSNGHLSRLSRVELVDGALGPEDVEIEPDGTLITGVADGRILRLRRGKQTVFADTHGRPLGIASDGQRGLWVADAQRGLLHVDRTGDVTVAVSEFEGQPFGCVDDVDLGRDGSVYFTDADAHWGLDQLKQAVLEGGPNGSLYRYDPVTQLTTRIVGGLYFANGVAVGPEGRYALVTETLRMRVLKVWLVPEKLGQTEIILENLPGYPDNISSAGAGAFWVALYGPRSALKDRAMPSPWLRKIAARIPGPGLTRTRRYSMAIAMDHLGRILQFMDDPTGAYAPVTSVHEFGGNLYLGSVEEPTIGRVTAPLRR